MASYHTVQKRQLTEFLLSHSERAFTAEEIAEQIKKELGADLAPGKSTVYRLIGKMADDGIVKRLVKGNSRRFVYQIAAGEHCATHLHMKCTECGRLLHMADEQSGSILLKIFAENNFRVDEKQTVLLGKCGKCAEGDATK